MGGGAMALTCTFVHRGCCLSGAAGRCGRCGALRGAAGRCGALVVAQGTSNRRSMLSTDEVPQLVMCPCSSSAALAFAAHSFTAVFKPAASLNVADGVGADGKAREACCGDGGGGILPTENDLFRRAAVEVSYEEATVTKMKGAIRLAL